MSAPNILDEPLEQPNHQPIPSVGWWFEYAGLVFLGAAMIAYFLPTNPTGNYSIFVYSFKGLFFRFTALAFYFHLVGGLYLFVNQYLKRRTSLLIGNLHFLLSMFTLLAAGGMIFQLSKVELNENCLQTFLEISSTASSSFFWVQVLLLHLFFGRRDQKD